MPRQSTGDLRSVAKSYQRDKNHAIKWSKGTRAAPGRPCSHNMSYNNEPCTACATRPVKKGSYGMHWREEKLQGKAHQVNLAKRVLVSDADEAAMSAHANSDTSDEEVVDPSAAPSIEQDVMYSYDATSGPTAAGNMLSNAVLHAVKKYENKQTERLVKQEYDLVLDGKDDVVVQDVDDEFELIDHVHME